MPMRARRNHPLSLHTRVSSDPFRGHGESRTGCNGFAQLSPSIELQNITNPCIVRTLSVPASATFHTLHCALQVAFGWGNCHLHSFEVLAAPRAPNARKVPRVLLKIDPSPNQYDDVFDPMPQNTKKLRLRDVYENAIYKDSAIEYWYDFGDDWMHSISLIGRALASTRQIVCLSGEGSPAEEDCGGPGGW
jgi:hypothetical protein